MSAGALTQQGLQNAVGTPSMLPVHLGAQLQNAAGTPSMLLSASGGTGQLQNAAGTPSMLLSASGGTGQLQNAAGTPSMLLSASGGTGQLQNAAGTPSMLLSGSGGSALRGLRLPTEEEVKMFLQITKSFPDPRKLPDFMKRRGKQSRPLAITDFVKPKRTDWLGFCRDFNLRVVTVWEQTKTLCNLYLKSEEHLQLHEKEIVSQASQAEVVHTTSAIGGLPAESSSYCQKPLQLQPPRDNQATRKGHGRGVADGTRQCGRCRKHAAVDVLLAGHDCMLYLISIGKDPRQYAHTQGKAAKLESLPTMEQAQEELAAKKRKIYQGVAWLWVTRHKQLGHVRDSPRSGRLHKASAAAVQHVLTAQLPECTGAADIATRTNQDVEVQSSRSRVTRILKRKGMQHLSPKVVLLLTAMQRAARIKWCTPANRGRVARPKTSIAVHAYMGCCRHGTTTLKFVTGTHKQASKHVNPKTKRLHTGVGQDEPIL
ncbi:TPA: hypothetical protein ACH3X1_000350 [Trebouxia sp. C0004]